MNITYLTSDLPAVGSVNDSNLVNPWGLSISPTVHGGYQITPRDCRLCTVVQANAVSGGDDPFCQWARHRHAERYRVQPLYHGFQDPRFRDPFLFCTGRRTVSGWYHGNVAFITVNNNNGAVYKGLTLASANGANYIYVANFHAATVEAYDDTYTATLVRAKCVRG